MKLAIGTAQFGLPYGLKNTGRSVEREEILNILGCARSKGISTLDTAIAYGNSEEVLGDIGVSNWNIVTKLPMIPEGVVLVESWVREQVQASLTRLKVSSVHAILLHAPDQLLDKNIGLKLQQSLEKIKLDGIVSKIGISIYSPEQLAATKDLLDLDIVQGPLNIFDRRLLSRGCLDDLKVKGIEFHARSVFLQGLLMFDEINLPQKFSKWKSNIEKFDQFLKLNKLDRVQACIAYVRELSQVDKIVIGIDNLIQLQQILAAYNTQAIPQSDFLECNDLTLIDPRSWNKI